MMNHYKEWIIQYHGDLKKILQGTGIMFDVISEKYALIKTSNRQISYLKSLGEIEHIEESRPIHEVTAQIDPEEIISMKRQRLDVSGEGITVGWIGHKLSVNDNNFSGKDGKSRIRFIHDGTREYSGNQVSYIRKGEEKPSWLDSLSPMDICIGNMGIAPNSHIILVNFEKDRLYTADAIRAIRYIIKKIPHPQSPLVIYFPFHIKDGLRGGSRLVEAIVRDMTLWGKITIVNSLETGHENQEESLGLSHAPIFSTCAPLTVGVLSLLMEWGIVKGNNPSLYGQKLRTYYIKKKISLSKKHGSYRRNSGHDHIGDLLNLLFLKPVMGECRSLDIPYELIAEDALIDALMTYNNLSVESTIKMTENITIYSLAYPHFGVRGVASEVRKILTENLGKTATGFLAFIAGIEPVKIKEISFKTTSILKQPVDFKGDGTLIGIIDTGIDYTDPAFIDTAGQTRIISIWDQTVGSSSPYGYGTVYNQEMINQALQSPDPLSIVPHEDEWGHGTILAGIAAGSSKYEDGRSYTGVAPEAGLVVVKLKSASPGMQDIFHSRYNPLGFSTLDIALAFQFLVNLANQYQRPISICLPSGTNSGSHDGTNVLDSVLNSYAANPGISVVLAAGEEANKEHHASGNLEENKEQEITLIVPKGQDSFVLAIWGMFGDQMEATITPPHIEGEVSPTILLNRAQTYKLENNSIVWSQGIKFDSDTGSQVIRIRLGNPRPGNWIIRVKGIVVIDGRYHMWIPKTGMILPETVLSPASPFTTIYNTSATLGLITVAAYDKRALAPSSSSGRGFTRDDRVKPDFMVEGIDIPGPLPGGKWGLITGTAASSAITTGVCSLIYESQIQKGGELANTTIMKAILVAQLKREPTLSYPNPSTGYGLLDINSNFYE